MCSGSHRGHQRFQGRSQERLEPCLEVEVSFYRVSPNSSAQVQRIQRQYLRTVVCIHGHSVRSGTVGEGVSSCNSTKQSLKLHSPSGLTVSMPFRYPVQSVRFPVPPCRYPVQIFRYPVRSIRYFVPLHDESPVGFPGLSRAVSFALTGPFNTSRARQHRVYLL